MKKISFTNRWHNRSMCRTCLNRPISRFTILRFIGSTWHALLHRKQIDIRQNYLGNSWSNWCPISSI